MKRAGRKYRQSERGRDHQRARSLTHYHRRGKVQRQQRRAGAAPVAQSGAPPAANQQVHREVAADTVRGEPLEQWLGWSRAGAPCLTHTSDGGAVMHSAMVESTPQVAAAQVLSSSGVEETADAKAAFFGDKRASQDGTHCAAANGDAAAGIDTIRAASERVLTTVAQLREVLSRARDDGRADVVVWGRCSACGRLGRVVHFDGAARAQVQDPDP